MSAETFQMDGEKKAFIPFLGKAKIQRLRYFENLCILFMET